MACKPLLTDLPTIGARSRSALTPRPVSQMLRRVFCASTKGVVTLDPIDSMIDRLDRVCAQRSETRAA